MKKFLRAIQQIIVKQKIAFVLRFVYPQKKKYSKIKSIIPKSIELGDEIVMEENINLSGTLRNIGSHTYIGRNAYIGFCSSIGKFCSISYDVKIGLISHPKNYVSTSPLFYSARRSWVKKSTFDEISNGACEIGHDVLISANTMILAGLKIGNGAIIGAGSLVNKDVPPYAIVAGIPARIIHYRFDDETIKRLLESEWWNLSDEVLHKYVEFMNDPNAFLDALSKDKV
jgi:acetyltransferase-like isoleucine patch superfamily enzyme